MRQGRGFLASATAWFWHNANHVPNAHGTPSHPPKKTMPELRYGRVSPRSRSGVGLRTRCIGCRLGIGYAGPRVNRVAFGLDHWQVPDPVMGLSPAFYAFSRIFILIRRPSGNIHLPASACNRPSFRAFRRSVWPCHSCPLQGLFLGGRSPLPAKILGGQRRAESGINRIVAHWRSALAHYVQVTLQDFDLL
jgi:hypothetical protein